MNENQAVCPNCGSIIVMYDNYESQEYGNTLFRSWDCACMKCHNEFIYEEWYEMTACKNYNKE